MLTLEITRQALREYESWLQEENTEVADRIDQILRSALETPYNGIGRPKPLIASLKGLWSRYINENNRLIYSVESGKLTVYQCRGSFIDGL